MTCKCNNNPDLLIKVLRSNAIIPKYQSAGASGFDLVIPQTYMIHPGQTVLIKLGWAVEVPEGYEMQVRPRSGISLNTEIVLKNSPGTIDSDYRGEVAIIACNRGQSSLTVFAGERLAQAVIAPIKRCNIKVVAELTTTDRGAGGFGSTWLRTIET